MPGKRLSRRDWIEAALAALGDGGVPAVSVERLAPRLGVTKGSFYWHFKERDELLSAALDMWEAERTGGVIARLEEIADPRERLAAWARQGFGADKALLVALHASAGHPLVAPVLRRVTERRIEYLAALLREAGRSAAQARRHALMLYATDVGLFEIGVVLAGGPPAGRELAALVDDVTTLYLP